MLSGCLQTLHFKNKRKGEEVAGVAPLKKGKVRKPLQFKVQTETGTIPMVRCFFSLTIHDITCYIKVFTNFKLYCITQILIFKKWKIFNCRKIMTHTRRL